MVDILDGSFQAAGDVLVISVAVASPCRRIPTAKSDWMTPSWSSFADPLSLLQDLEPLELPALALGLVVEASVLDGDGGLGREHNEDSLVLLVERLGALLVGEIDVPEHPSPPGDRSPEEGLHRRMIRGEPDRPRVGADVGDPQWTGFGDERAEEAVAGRRVAERGAFLGRDPDRDELLDQPPIGREHAERSISRVGEVDRQLDDPQEHRVEG